MNVLSRRWLIAALTLILLSSGCNLPAQTSSPVPTVFTQEQLSPVVLPTNTLGLETPTVVIPVTGMDVVSLQCQFCVNDEPHAVLIMPESASFLVPPDPGTRVNCLTAQVVSGKRIIFCRGVQQASFNLNVCVDNSNCFQYPITLERCPVSPQVGSGTPVFLNPVVTAVPLTQPADTQVPLPTQIVVSPSPVVATTAVPVQPTVTSPPVVPTTALPPQPTSTLPPAATVTPLPPEPTGTPGPTRLPRSGLHDPEGFIRWYFERVWKERDYQNIWDNYLTPSFKSHASSNNFAEYAAWWDSVERVDVNSVDLYENDGAHAWVRVNVTFHMRDGRVISNQEYDYDLLYDPTRQTWMFDYLPQ